MLNEKHTSQDKSGQEGGQDGKKGTERADDSSLESNSIDDILRQKEALDRRLKEARKEEIRKAESHLKSVAAKLNLSLADLLDEIQLLAGISRKGKRKSAGTAPIVFRHPTDPNHRGWSGVGRVPGWMLEYEQSGKSREDLRIQD